VESLQAAQLKALVIAAQPVVGVETFLITSLLPGHHDRKEMWRTANAEGSTVLIIPTLPTNAL